MELSKHQNHGYIVIRHQKSTRWFAAGTDQQANEWKRLWKLDDLLQFIGRAGPCKEPPTKFYQGLSNTWRIF